MSHRTQCLIEADDLTHEAKFLLEQAHASLLAPADPGCHELAEKLWAAMGQVNAVRAEVTGRLVAARATNQKGTT